MALLEDNDLTAAELLQKFGIFAEETKPTPVPALEHTPSAPTPRPSLTQLTNLVSGTDPEAGSEETPG